MCEVVRNLCVAPKSRQRKSQKIVIQRTNSERKDNDWYVELSNDQKLYSNDNRPALNPRLTQCGSPIRVSICVLQKACQPFKMA